jgi:hypothetical protein
VVSNTSAHIDCPAALQERDIGGCPVDGRIWTGARREFIVNDRADRSAFLATLFQRGERFRIMGGPCRVPIVWNKAGRRCGVLEGVHEGKANLFARPGGRNSEYELYSAPLKRSRLGTSAASPANADVIAEADSPVWQALFCGPPLRF